MKLTEKRIRRKLVTGIFEPKTNEEIKIYLDKYIKLTKGYLLYDSTEEISKHVSEHFTNTFNRKDKVSFGFLGNKVEISFNSFSDRKAGWDRQQGLVNAYGYGEDGLSLLNVEVTFRYNKFIKALAMKKGVHIKYASERHLNCISSKRMFLWIIPTMWKYSIGIEKDLGYLKENNYTARKNGLYIEKEYFKYPDQEQKLEIKYVR